MRVLVEDLEDDAADDEGEQNSVELVLLTHLRWLFSRKTFFAINIHFCFTWRTYFNWEALAVSRAMSSIPCAFFRHRGGDETEYLDTKTVGPKHNLAFQTMGRNLVENGQK